MHVSIILSPSKRAKENGGKFFFFLPYNLNRGFSGGSVVKNLPANAGDARDPHPGSGQSPGEGNVNPLQYSGLENPMDRGAWLATSPRVTKS